MLPIRFPLMTALSLVRFAGSCYLYLTDRAICRLFVLLFAGVGQVLWITRVVGGCASVRYKLGVGQVQTELWITLPSGRGSRATQERLESDSAGPSDRDKPPPGGVGQVQIDKPVCDVAWLPKIIKVCALRRISFLGKMSLRCRHPQSEFPHRPRVEGQEWGPKGGSQEGGGSEVKVLLILSPKGGSGKSTMARSLAPAAAGDGLAVAALDLDPQGTTARWCKRRAARDDAVSEVAGFVAEVENGPRACAAIEGADGVIIDTPTAIEKYPEPMLALIKLADLVMIPTQSSHDDTVSVEPIMRTVVAQQRRGVFLLNRLKPRVAENEAARVKLARTADVFSASVPDSIQLQRATAHGLSVCEAGGVGAEEILSVWAEVRRRLEIVI